MKLWPIASGVAVVALCATAFAMVVRSDPQARAESAAEAPAPAKTKQLRDAPHDPDAEQRVAELAAKTDALSQRELVELYGLWAGQDDKVWARRQIVDGLLAMGDRKRALKLLLDALGEDATAVADDEMLDYAADKLHAYWSDPALYDYGRDLLLVQGEEKPRAMLARSLVDYTARLDENADPEYQKRTGLASDMVDVYYATKDDASREHMLTGLDELGASDMSKFMRNPNMDPKELASVKLHIDATENAIADLDDEFAGESDQDWDGMLAPLRALAGLEREELEAHALRTD